MTLFSDVSAVGRNGAPFVHSDQATAGEPQPTLNVSVADQEPPPRTATGTTPPRPVAARPDHEPAGNGTPPSRRARRSTIHTLRTNAARWDAWGYPNCAARAHAKADELEAQ